MFNKAVRKFTNLIKASFEKEIDKQIADEEQGAKQAIGDLQVTTLKAENVNQDEFTAKMQHEKSKFIQKHTISQHHSNTI